MRRLRLGIFGGTFDPVHNGHLMLARVMQEKLQLDRVLFIPDHISPFKQQEVHAPDSDRLAMLRLAVQENPCYLLSTRELKRGGVSYTYDTLRQLHRKLHRVYELYFLLGADAAEQLGGWYRIQDSMRLAIFAAAARPGFAPYKKQVTARLQQQGLDRLLWVDTPEVELSSTNVRQCIKERKSIGELVPQAVAEYIEQRDLYRR